MLSGDIGSGKTTLLLAVEFALFGLSRKTITGDLLLRHGKHEGSVELHFSIKKGNTESNVIIKRNLRRANQVKQESGYIIVDNLKTECTPVELKTRVLNLLGYPQEMITKATDIIYRYTVYTPQEQMKQILFENVNVRLDTLRKVFDIDKYKRINHNSYHIQKSLKNRKAILIGKSSDLEEKKKQYEEVIQQKSVHQEKIKQLLPELEKTTAELKNKTDELLKIEQQIKEFHELKNQFAINEVKHKNYIQQKQDNEDKSTRLLNQIKSLETEIAEFKIIKPEEVNKSILEKALKEEEDLLEIIKSDKIHLTKEIEFNNSKIEQLSSEIKEKREAAKDIVKKKQEMESIEKEIEKKSILMNELKSMEKAIHELNLKIKENEIGIDKANKLKNDIVDIDKCPLCLQNIGSNHKDEIVITENQTIKDFNKEITEMEVERKERVKEIEDKNNLIEQLREKEKLIEKLKAEFKNIQEQNQELSKKQAILEELVKIRNQLNEKKADLENKDPRLLQDKINQRKEILTKINEYENRIKQKELMEKSYQEKSQELQNIKESLTKFSEDIQTTKSLIEDLEKKITAFAEIEDKNSLLKQEVVSQQKKEKELELNLSLTKKQIENLEQRSLQISDEIKNKEQAKLKIDDIDKLVSWIDNFFSNLMNTMERHIMIKLYHEFNELFINWFDMLMEDENLSARLNEDFSPIIIQNGYETSVENLSGGERSAVALAYRLALNKVINSFITTINTKEIIVLDEPTDGFSQEQLDKIKDVLDELNIAQVIIVSHESKIESFAEHIVRIGKTEHTSRVLA